MGVDDSVTGGRKREGKTLMEGDTSSPARHTRAATKEDREMGVDDAVTVGRKREGKTSMEGDMSSPQTIRKKRKDQWDLICPNYRFKVHNFEVQSQQFHQRTVQR
jgi:hypothetical protein